MNNILESLDLLSSAINLIAKEAKNQNIVGQWHESIIKALEYSKKARESLEGIQ